MSKTEVRESRIPGVPDGPELAGDLKGTADDFEPQEPSEPETDPDNPATGDGGDPFPVPGSGFRSQ